MSTGKNEHPSIAILCLTKPGARLAHRLAGQIPESHLYLPKRLQKDGKAGPQTSYFEDFAVCFSNLFRSYKGLICIMAAGIAVRSLNGLMGSKYTDPAVVVVDEKGRFAISLLSGHRGGANRLAEWVAHHLGGQAVITTSTDVNGKPAVDVMAQEIDAIVRPAGTVKIINRALAEGKQCTCTAPWPLNPEWAQGFVTHPPLDIPAGTGQPLVNSINTPAVVVDCRYYAPDKDDVVLLLPRNLHVGIGCRKGVSCEQLDMAVRTVLDGFGIDQGCIVSLASIDIKRNETALQQLASELELPLQFFDKDTLAALEGSFAGSAWVKQHIGVDGVCEPAARLAAKMGITVVPKQKIGPVTISVGMEKSWWWDWDRAAQNS